ncbi:uncharacterized protein LOC132340518 [Haemorhous mexicanus]|uniref:uncharacterized protein LOC132340518 n=1 Tax=Haemorhous mexicanus TaxID=30427 RepID=UPI0028BEA03F|nr:uncharacterized protein LOC132340518 [Haemorhous mexicanus]
MEPKELSPAMLQPPVTVVATLGELLATLPRRDEEMRLFKYPGCLHWDLQDFTTNLQSTLYRADDFWRCRNVTSNDDDPPTSLSQALAAYKSTPGTTWDRVTMATSMWQWSVSVLGNSWVQLARTASRLRNTCRQAATEAADRASTSTARAGELQAEAARDGTALENMEELGQALGGEEGAEGAARTESQVREEARGTSCEAARATMVGEGVEEPLGLLERLVAACIEAIAFPRGLWRLLEDTKAALEGASEASPNVPEDLVAKVAMAERLWEANVRLVKDHLGKTFPDIIDILFSGGPASCTACGVAERCQRAIEDIPRLVQPSEHPQGVPKVSPVSMETQELSPALLQLPITVVAILGELLAALCSLHEVRRLLKSQGCLYNDLGDFTVELQDSLCHINDPWWHRIFHSRDGDPPATLVQALDTYRNFPLTVSSCVTRVARQWEGLVSVCVNSWAQLTRKATELCNTWREVATRVADRVATATARARELQDEAARDGTAQENMGELGQALGGEEGARHKAQIREEAREAASKATRASMVGQRVEAALGLLERLVAACDEATAFPRELQRLLRDTEAILKGTSKAPPNVPEALVAQVAQAKRLWVANARLAKDHLVGAVDRITEFYFIDGPGRASDHVVAIRCHKAIEDIPKLLQG